MARIRTTARLATPTSSEALQREEKCFGHHANFHGANFQSMKASSRPKSKSSLKATEEEHENHPSMPSYIEMDWSILKDKYLKVMKGLGYFDDKFKVRLAGDETTPKLKNREVVVFRSFFRAGLRLPMYQMIAKVLQKYKVYMHQLTPNAIARLGVFISSVRSQGVGTQANAFCRVHDLHY
jgi:hypothetical protein